MVVPLLGLVAFLVNICFCLHTEELDMNDFKERFDIDFVDPWDEAKSSEMADLNKNQVAADGAGKTAD